MPGPDKSKVRTQDIDLTPPDYQWGGVDPQIRRIIQMASEQFELPEDRLMRQVKAESNFQPTAGNGRPAKGLMQLMPLMQKHFGVTDPFDPQQNVQAGAQYMRQLLDKYGQNWDLALSAYNAGPTAVRKAGNKIPKIKETQDYVRRVLMGDR